MLRYITATVFACAFALPALAQPICGIRDDIVAKLKNDFQERRMAVAIGADGSLLEFFIAPSGTWSVIRRNPGSTVTCLVASGYNWSEDPTWPKDHGVES